MKTYFFANTGEILIGAEEGSTVATEKKDGWLVGISINCAYEISLGRSTGITCQLKNLPSEIKLKLLMLGETV